MKLTVEHGKWLPTNYLRFTHGNKLQQKMRRRVKQFPEQGRTTYHYEYEWQDVAEIIGTQSL